MLMSILLEYANPRNILIQLGFLEDKSRLASRDRLS